MTERYPYRVPQSMVDFAGRWPTHGFFTQAGDGFVIVRCCVCDYFRWEPA